MPDEISTAQAADVLGVSDRQVRHLVVKGEVVSPRRGVIDTASLEAYQARRGAVVTRVWEPVTAWAALELLSGGNAAWLGSSQRSRLRQDLVRLDAEHVVSRLRNRADVRTYRVDVARLPDVAREVVVVRSGDTALDVYVEEMTLFRLVSEHRMVRTDHGNLIARVLPEAVGQDFAAAVSGDSTLIAGVDLATSTDETERRIGLGIVTDAISHLAARRA